MAGGLTNRNEHYHIYDYETDFFSSMTTYHGLVLIWYLLSTMYLTVYNVLKQLPFCENIQLQVLVGQMVLADYRNNFV